MKYVVLVELLAVLATMLPSAESSMPLDEAFLEVAYTAAKLSALAYATDFSEFIAGDGTYAHPDYDEFFVYTEEPDQALLVAVDNKCYVAFRGTKKNLADWQQNFNLDDRQIHQDANETLPSCEVRAGFADFLFSSVVGTAQQDLFACVENHCESPADCVIITGHSQGGAASLVLSILTYSLMPTIITFGMPPAAEPGCDLVPSERFYRFVNSKKEDDEDDDVAFDPIPFSPNWFSGSEHYGHFIVLGDDESNAAYAGFDTDLTFEPAFRDSQNEFSAHSIDGAPYSYESRIGSLLRTAQNTSMPVSTDGFADGTVCKPIYNVLCESGSCQNFLCAPKVEELCIKNSCQEDADCSSGVCIWDACAIAEGEVALDCPCGLNKHCASGQCDISLSLSLDWTCHNGTDSGSAATSLFLSMATMPGVAALLL